MCGYEYRRVPKGYGPGDSALDHTPDERLSIEEIARSARVLELVLRTVMRAG